MTSGFCPVCNNRSGYNISSMEVLVCDHCGALFNHTPFGPDLQLVDARDRFPEISDYDVDRWKGEPIYRKPLPELSDPSVGIEKEIVIWQNEHPIVDGVLCLRQEIKKCP